ncbi:MmcQ/YjbR family DNA-binding protein [Clostridia bacterium OttesenSCG-928-F22]|nr:MmcQ/YjbR family DNA-binding protein [Clostridia bacterium OttesenSCG-928-F22]
MMDCQWVQEYMLQKPGVETDYKVEWASQRYMVSGKMFCRIGPDKTGTPIVTLKLRPENGELFRKQFPGDVVPGYYANKEHWNSIYMNGNVPDDILRGMMDEAYQLILNGLSKKVQVEILKR